MWVFIITGGTLLLVSLLWYFFIETRLREKRDSIQGDATPLAEGRLSQLPRRQFIDFLRASAEKRLELNLGSLAGFLGESGQEEEEHETKPIKIDRKLHIDYSRSQYINQAIRVMIRIASTKGDPLSEVELKFAEGEFKANKTKEQKQLETDGETRFDFYLKPSKAEDCILTVVISYIADSSSKVPEPIVRSVIIDKTSSVDGGTETKEHTEQVTKTPATAEAAALIVWTDDLVVTVKSLLGINAAGLDLLKNAVGILAALILLGIALVSGRTDGASAIAWGIASLASVLGVPVTDQIMKNFFPAKTDQRQTHQGAGNGGTTH